MKIFAYLTTGFIISAMLNILLLWSEVRTSKAAIQDLYISQQAVGRKLKKMEGRGDEGFQKSFLIIEQRNSISI